MLRNRKLQKLLLCLALEMAALIGAPMKPEEIEDLLRNNRQAAIECTSRKDSRDPLMPLPEGGEPCL